MSDGYEPPWKAPEPLEVLAHWEETDEGWVLHNGVIDLKLTQRGGRWHLHSSRLLLGGAPMPDKDLDELQEMAITIAVGRAAQFSRYYESVTEDFCEATFHLRNGHLLEGEWV